MSQIYVPFTSSSPIPPEIPTEFVTNDGSAIPAANVINILTDNSTVVFEGSGNTITLDFGLSNLILGSEAPSLTSGNTNTGLGFNSLRLITSGSSNTAIGWSSGAGITTGINNVLVGVGAGGNIATSAGSVAIGSGALQDATGQHNTSVGFNSLADITTGSENIALGIEAGFGYKSSESSNIVIGNQGTIGESNTIRIGTQGVASGQQSTCYVAGIANVSVSNAEVVTVNTSTGQLGSESLSSLGVSAIVGTANQVLANATSGSSQTGSVTLTTPQDIAPTSDVTFNSIKTGDGAVGSPAYSFTADTDTGMYRTAGGRLSLVVDGVTYVDIPTTGIVEFPVSIAVTNRTTTSTFAMGYTSGAGNLVDAGSSTIYGFTSTAAPRTMTLAAPAIPGRIVVVKDESGGAGTNNITVSVSGGALIDGAATFVMNTNYGSTSFYDTGSAYFIM